MKREASKSRNHIIIKGTQAAQEKISVTFATTNNPTMGFLPSSLKHHPEANSRHQTLQNISPNPYNAATNKRTMRFLQVATKLLHLITDEFAHHVHRHRESDMIPSSPPGLLVPPYLGGLSYNLTEQPQRIKGKNPPTSLTSSY
jgi:hypothetical protein